jgi:hypothetical protein
MECDGKAFGLRRDAKGEITGWFAAGATRFSADGMELLVASSPVSATASFAEVGRIDLAGEGKARFAVPARYRQGVRPEGQSLTLTGTLVLSGTDSVDLWVEQPVPLGEVELALVAGEKSTVLRGLRNRRGESLVQGVLGFAPGVYRLELPSGVSLSGVAVQADGTVWLAGRERISLQGRLPERLALEPVRTAIPLDAQPRSRLPKGVVHEAETGWKETGGSIGIFPGTVWPGRSRCRKRASTSSGSSVPPRLAWPGTCR